MTLVRTNTGYSAIPSLLDSVLTRDWMDWGDSNYSGRNAKIPAVNVAENKDEYKIEVAAPGMNKSDFHVTVENDELTISSEFGKENSEDEKVTYSRKEFDYKSFSRKFTLPEGAVNSEKINAKYEDGILYLTLPKREEVKPKPARQIEIV